MTVCRVRDILILIWIGKKAVAPIMLKVIAVIPITSLKMNLYRFINHHFGTLPNGKHDYGGGANAFGQVDVDDWSKDRFRWPSRTMVVTQARLTDKALEV